MQWGVAGQLGVALGLLERCSRVGVATHDLGTAVAQRTLKLSLEGRQEDGWKPLHQISINTANSSRKKAENSQCSKNSPDS